MVAIGFTALEGKAKWAFYLALSLCVNVLIAQAITLGIPKEKLINIPTIKLNLKVLPIVKHQPIENTQQSEASAKASSEEVLIEKLAKKKVAVSEAELITIAKLEKHALNPMNQNTMPLAKALIEKEIIKEMPIELEMIDIETEVSSQLNSTQNLSPEKTDLKLAKVEDSAFLLHEASYRKQTPPMYPHRAFELGQEGTVTLHAEVMVNGLPRELKIIKSSGHRLLDTAALAAVKNWEFEPTSVNGTAIISWVRVPVNFVIK